MLTELTIKEFIHKVISNDPVPGGGSVSAFNGALATSLAAMVANLTIGRKKYAEVNEVMEDLSARFEELARQLIIDVDRDSDAYNRVFAAFKLPKETEEEKAEKARVMEIVLKDACSVPMEIMEKCCEAIELIVEFGAKGSKLAISDAGVGAAFCKAALKGASLNVYINTKSMADRAYAEELNKKADAMLEKYTKIADETFDSVLGRLK